MSQETIPLIYTSKGNLPISDLEYKTEWLDHPDYMTFSETYFLAGEVVKHSVHAYQKKGMDFLGDIGSF